VRLLSPDIGAVAALEEVSPASAHDLASALAVGAAILVIAPVPLVRSEQLDVLSVKPVLQMVAAQPVAPDPALSAVELGPADVSRMLALVDLARPGPLGPRAMELGGFFGIFADDELVALAGERLRLNGYAEVASQVDQDVKAQRHSLPPGCRGNSRASLRVMISTGAVPAAEPSSVRYTVKAKASAQLRRYLLNKALQRPSSILDCARHWLALGCCLKACLSRLYFGEQVAQPGPNDDGIPIGRVSRVATVPVECQLRLPLHDVLGEGASNLLEAAALHHFSISSSRQGRFRDCHRTNSHQGP